MSGGGGVAEGCDLLGGVSLPLVLGWQGFPVPQMGEGRRGMDGGR